jgi:hypothetical protein
VNWVAGAALTSTVYVWFWVRFVLRPARRRRLSRSLEVERYVPPTPQPEPQPRGDSLDRQFAVAVVRAADRYVEMRDG